MLTSEITRAPRRWRILASLALAFALGAITTFAFLQPRDATFPAPPAPVPAVVPTPVALAPVALAPVAPAPVALIDEPLVKLVAASDAPVIAVASDHRVWISRDDGKTFAPALQGAGTGPRGTRLISVTGHGVVRQRVLANLVGGVVLDPGITCEIAGNEHAAYLALDDVAFRIDTREPRILDHTPDEFHAIAVDAHGDLLVLARRCVRRFHAEPRREDELVCGPAQR